MGQGKFCLSGPTVREPGAPVENVWLTVLVITLIGMAGLLTLMIVH